MKKRRGDAIHQRGPSWFLDCEIDGRHFHRKLGRHISRSVAVEIAHKYRAEILSGNVGYGKKAKDLTFDEARKQFEAWAVKEKKPLTAKSYQECLRRLAESFSGKHLSQISPITVERHKHDRKDAPIRANRELATLK